MFPGVGVGGNPSKYLWGSQPFVLRGNGSGCEHRTCPSLRLCFEAGLHYVTLAGHTTSECQNYGWRHILPSAFTFFLFVCGHVPAVIMCREKSEDNFESWLSPSSVWIPGRQVWKQVPLFTEPSRLAGFQFLNMNFFFSCNCSPNCSMQLKFSPFIL